MFGFSATITIPSCMHIHLSSDTMAILMVSTEFELPKHFSPRNGESTASSLSLHCSCVRAESVQFMLPGQSTLI